MDTKKMRACAPLLPAPGDTVIIECLDEIERLRAALDKIAVSTGSDDRWRHLVQIARDALAA